MRILISILPILIYLAVLVIIDAQSITKVRTLIFAFVYGIIISALSYILGGLIFNSFASLTGLNAGYFSLTIVPLLEENLKILLVIFFIKKKLFRSIKAAVITGITIGLGFSIVGNVFILKSIADLPTVELIIRGIITACKQGLITGIASLIIFLLNRNYNFKLLHASIISILIAVILHSISNYYFSNLYISIFINLLIFPILSFCLIKIKTKKR